MQYQHALCLRSTDSSRRLCKVRPLLVRDQNSNLSFCICLPKRLIQNKAIKTGALRVIRVIGKLNFYINLVCCAVNYMWLMSRCRIWQLAASRPHWQ